MGVYEEVKQALQDIVAPELRSLQVEIKRLDDKIDSGLKRLDEKIDSLRNEVTTEIGSLRTGLTTEIKRLDEKIESLDEKIDIAIQIRERLASLEARVTAMGH